MKWLKDEKQRTLQGVESDKKLTEKQKEILRGILKRNNKHVDRPSRADLELLKKHYGNIYVHTHTHTHTHKHSMLNKLAFLSIASVIANSHARTHR